MLGGRWQAHTISGKIDKVYTIERNRLFIDELDDFINRPQQCLLPDLDNSVVTLKIIDAIRQSAKEEIWINL